MKKIAFCFLVRDNIIHEEVWNTFFNNVDINKYNIYIHFKTNQPSKYFQKYKLANCIETAWGRISLVKAQNLLLIDALNDKDNEHFVFLSESCIPFKSFNHVYNSLNEKYSYFNVAPHKACFPKCNIVLKHINREYIQKASQWCILNRKHTELMIAHADKYIKWFNSVPAPDEHCYLTNMYVNNLQNEIIATLNLADGATTFTNWYGMRYKYPATNKNALKFYDIITSEELEYLLAQKCLFGRKFTNKCASYLTNLFYINSISSFNI